MKKNNVITWCDWRVDLNQGFDLSVGLFDPERWVRAWYQDAPSLKAVEMEGFVGSTDKGSPVNFKNIHFNPHAHCTHTETFAHISSDVHPISDLSFPLLMKALVVTVTPKKSGGDEWLLPDEVIWPASKENVEALVIRTGLLQDRINRDYSQSNPPYLDLSWAPVLKEWGVRHLLIDLPSVDKEKDDGALRFHHAFWDYPEVKWKDKSITEFAVVPDAVKDGYYALSLQVMRISSDASISRPILYNRLQ